VTLRPSSLAFLVAAGLGAAVVGFAASRRARVPASTAAPSATLPLEPALVLHVPHVKGNIVLDGDMDDPGWQRCARTQAFVGPDGISAARPYSEARLVWGDGVLYMGL
jgi:hypothetical protein